MGIQFPPNLLVGTSSWSSADWVGTFYPEKTPASEMISCYSRKLRTVEIDATWHGMPTASMADAWKSRTAPGFIFSAKVPKVITHEKYLEDCGAELTEYVTVMERLGEKLGPMILQFPYVAKGKDPEEYQTGADFLSRLRRFVPLLPDGFQWGIEIRNSRWVGPELLETLRSRSVSLIFIDYYTMDPLAKLARRWDVFTAPFVYIRFLGNHKEMDATVKRAQEEGRRKRTWEGLIVDRTVEMRQWVPSIKEAVARQVPVYVYFNNHYAGYAPGSVELFSLLYNQSLAAEAQRTL